MSNEAPGNEENENGPKNGVLNTETIVTEKQCNNAKSTVDLDDLLTHAGDFGRYQITMFISTFPFYVFGVFSYYSQMFMTEASSQYWCWIPELENLTTIERRSLAIPIDENGRYGYSQCLSYDVNWTEALTAGQKPDPTWATVPCNYGWEFNTTEFPYPTVSSEWGWVCDKNSYQASAQSIFFIGSIVGGLIFGWVADKYGRLPVIILSNIVGCVGGLASTFTRNFTEFSLCRFIMGMSYDNCMMMSYLLVLEFIAPRHRTMIANLSFALFYTTAAVSLPWVALACGHWKIISLVTSIPLGLAVLSPLIFMESPRWLLSNGRVDDAIKKLLVIGRSNKKEIPPKMIENFKLSLSKQNDGENYNTFDILKRPKLRQMFIVICIVYMCCGIVFDALVRSIGQLDFDFFKSFSVVSFTEFPSLIIVAFVMDWMGRRWLTALMMLTSCLFSVMTVFIGGGLPSVMCAVIARFTINMAYSACMQWGAEMLPTSVRGSGVSIIHICGSIATVVSPYIVYLETFVYWLPLVVVGSLSAIGGVLALLLPETTNKDMPQTFEDAERLVKNIKFWDIPCLQSKSNSKTYVTSC